MNSSKVTVSVIKCITALACCVSLAVGALNLTDKVCNTEKSIAALSNEATAALPDDNGLSDNTNYEASNNVNTSDASLTPSDITNDVTYTQDESSAQNVASVNNESSKKISLSSGLTSTNVADVLKFYQLAAKKNADKKVLKSLVLISMDGGKTISKKAMSVFEPVAKKALEANSNKEESFPGKPDKILPSDWLSASATNDGTYTTLNIKVKPQTDGPYGKEFEGSVGRSMGVLDGFGRAIDEMSIVSADFKNGKVDIQYLNPTIKIKVKNSTGELVKGACEWYYRTHPTLYYLDGKFAVFNIHLENSNGYIDYILKY